MTYKIQETRIVLIFCTIFQLFSVAYCEAAGNDGSKQYVKGEIIANILNVRAKPAVKFEVVCQLRKGDIIDIKKTQGEWLGISAPHHAEAWISKNKLDSENKTIDKTFVYSGPGTIFSTYTTLVKNYTVQKVKVYEDKWVKIIPPDNAIVWIHRNYVRKEMVKNPSSTPDSSTVEKINSHSSQKPLEEKHSQRHDKNESDIKEPTESNRVAPLAGKPVEPTLTYIGKSKKVEKTGTIILLGDDHKPFTYSIAISIDSQYYPLAYLSSGNFNLDDWNRQKVKLKGRQRWLKGWPRPVIEIDSLESIEGID